MHTPHPTVPLSMRDDERQECIPASLGCKANRVVGDDRPDEGLDKGDRQAHDGGGDHKRPAGEEEVISLLEEDFHSVNLQVSVFGHALWWHTAPYAMYLLCMLRKWNGKMTMLAMPKTLKCEVS